MIEFWSILGAAFKCLDSGNIVQGEGGFDHSRVVHVEGGAWGEVCAPFCFLCFSFMK